MFENSRHIDCQLIYWIFTKIYLKQNKNKIKGVGMKTQCGSREFDRTSFMPKEKESTN